MAHNLAILSTALLVIIAAHSLCSTKIYNVMAQEDHNVLELATKLYQEDPYCGEPCTTMANCSTNLYCQACSNNTCELFIGDAIGQGM
ncbi:metallocarboxypeptidase inhibitor-like [Capsicum annuum]|uniref:metallocarboxypeptidase inhibitor-like n=1 Tax=Capsicum annuum TaxID=4072 RepID=UPI001FB12D8F|nr:metallocarboxypeptidase inhibitor-like [Capsicum annuum]